ncbi:hypothetical protein [Spirulina sp. 06S082]|uniref:hypothetical protein n=1 Tax=Spirulina sp. 06S082 TaxID=3110248 RepID=UPI002B215631|nr:hypothetical protein [Spirulina sp. 06S082]MEA5472557.1 hypothetical protein [Spirulina sp. 06S082]
MSYALENFAIKEENKQFRIVFKVSDSFSPTSKTILDKSFPAYISIFVVPLVVALVAILIITSIFLAALTSALDSIRNLVSPPYQPSYEEAQKWFEDGNGYLANLSEEEKKKLRIKKDLPLGL